MCGTWGYVLGRFCGAQTPQRQNTRAYLHAKQTTANSRRPLAKYRKASDVNHHKIATCMQIAANHGNASQSTTECPNLHRNAIAKTPRTLGEKHTPNLPRVAYTFSQLTFSSYQVAVTAVENASKRGNGSIPRPSYTTFRPHSEVKRRWARLYSTFLLHDVADVSPQPKNSLVHMVIS